MAGDEDDVGVLSYRVAQVEKEVAELKTSFGIMRGEVSQAKTDIAVLVKAVEDNTSALHESGEKRFNWINLLLPIAVTLIMFIGQYLATQNQQKMQQEIARSNSEMIQQVKAIMEAK